MIHIIYREIVIRQESKERFAYLIRNWNDFVKKQELNLSFDLCWKNENTLVVIERWSTAVAYNNFLKLEETKSINKELEKFIDYNAKVERLNVNV
ncbi:hypothetical protein FCM49_00685 [Mycoplasma bovis]|uniref:ABM domain-containing protein n=1 Tax=Mycoplasmopsis bovis TaxID=28903 RepID=A0A2N8U1V2_MYCBV|nr:antibiotic biosynthesis monooxygenase [Mycoplasmopsis bovis]AXJ69855.1 hypothetical protein CH328_01205 [Mycoplasmopsis bovis]MBT1315659.1 hypothetical protein [Mycoplasmopsis bovis]MBT1316310.1 hypothetical protein [Mycoplasmopsis bovis]MBT1317147.1 hypothetical protein [Mycoplasmopsis bovis]MBT1317937.1 hypothetical protein [Mycoplasmopsis bovis]